MSRRMLALCLAAMALGAAICRHGIRTRREIDAEMDAAERAEWPDLGRP